MRLLNHQINFATLCSLSLFVNFLVEAKNVAPLDIVFDKESGKYKRHLPSSGAGKGLFRRKDGTSHYLKLDELFDSTLEKRNAPGGDQEFFEPLRSTGDMQDEESLNPICLNSRLPSMNEISIFAGYLRDDVSIAQMMENPAENVIVFAPTDEAIESLPLKPWEFPADINAIESSTNDEETIDKLVNSNILHFVKSHIATGTSIDKAKTMKKCMGRTIVLRSYAFEGDESSGDIMLKKEGDEYFVASSIDRKLKKVLRVEHAQNGLILVIGSTLISS